MIFLRCDQFGKIVETHYNPFHPIFGMRKTEEQLLNEGLLVEVLPTKLTEKEGFEQVLYVNEDGSLEWRQVQIAIDEQERRMNQLEQENAHLIFLNAMQESRIGDLENENANILLELAMIKGGN